MQHSMKDDYQLMIDAISDYAIYMLDRDGCVTTWNSGAQRMKGYGPDEIIGQHYGIFFSQYDRDKEKPAKELRTALKKGRYEEEGWRVRKDGSRFWANVVVTPVYTDTGEHVGFAKVTRDLTEKRRNEELYLLLVNQVKEYAIFMMDIEGRILTWNEGAERIKGYTAHEIVGKHFSSFYSAEEKAEGKPQWELEIAVRTGKYEEEGWRIRKDGSRFWASVVITPIYTDRHIGFAKVTRDLTQRRELEQLSRANLVLQTSNKELERFAFTASHDLKEPLRKISMFSKNLLKGTEELSARQRDYLEKIVASTVRMDDMIEDVLEFSALSLKQHFRRYSLQQVVDEARELLEGTVELKKAQFTCDVLPEATIVPSQMRQLFQNLFSNSLKFAKADIPPVIEISCAYLDKEEVEAEKFWPSNRYLRLVVKDNGIGFEQEDAERIFVLFDRLHGRSAYEGTGVGLAICKKIVENHGGTIHATSTPGEGAAFTIVIPG